MTKASAPYNTRSADIDWDGLEQDVVSRLRLLRTAWESSERTAPPEMHARMVSDLYIPAIEALGRFCASVEIDGEGTA